MIRGGLMLKNTSEKIKITQWGGGYYFNKIPFKNCLIMQ
jgi:hypothetical protein